MINYQDYLNIVRCAQEVPTSEQLLGELYWAPWMDSFGTGEEGVETIAAIVEEIFAIANAENNATVRKIAGLTQAKMAERYAIPLRTLQNWEVRPPSAGSYIFLLLGYAVLCDKYSAKEGCYNGQA